LYAAVDVRAESEGSANYMSQITLHTQQKKVEEKVNLKERI
jgi:hypothetical protein